MNGIIRNLVPLLLLMTGSVAFGQANGWKIETLAPLVMNTPSGFIPTRRVAVNDVGQIAFVRPDGVYVREPSGTISKRMGEVGSSTHTTSEASGLALYVNLTSVGIDNNGVVYAGQNGIVYRQAPGEATEVLLRTPAELELPSLIGSIVVTGTGNVFVGVGVIIGSQPGPEILRWSGSAFESIYVGPQTGAIVFPIDAKEDSVVVQTYPFADLALMRNSYVGQFGRIDGSTYTDISSLRILGSPFFFGKAMSLSSTDTFAYAQGNLTSETPSVGVTKVVGSTASSFMLDGRSSAIGSISVNGSGEIAYAARFEQDNYEGVFQGPDSALDSILLARTTLEGGDRKVTNLMVHDITDSGEVILSYIDSLGDSYLARATPLPSLVNLVNPSFVDGLNGWQTEGEVLPLANTQGNSSLAAIGDSGAIFQTIHLPSVPFQIELITPPTYAFLTPSVSVFLGNSLLTPEPSVFGDPVRRFIVTDPSLLGRSNVTFRIAATNSPTIIDGIRITAVPEVRGVLLVAGALGILMIVQYNWRRARG